jgi:hypothetical protein
VPPRTAPVKMSLGTETAVAQSEKLAFRTTGTARRRDGQHAPEPHHADAQVTQVTQVTRSAGLHRSDRVAPDRPPATCNLQPATCNPQSAIRKATHHGDHAPNHTPPSYARRANSRSCRRRSLAGCSCGGTAPSEEVQPAHPGLQRRRACNHPGAGAQTTAEFGLIPSQAAQIGNQP